MSASVASLSSRPNGLTFLTAFVALGSAAFILWLKTAREAPDEEEQTPEPVHHYSYNDIDVPPAD